MGSIVAAGGFTMLVKNLLYKYRRPNGKKGGIISFHATVAFATVASIAMITKDWFLTALTVLLAYLIGRGRMDEGQHYMYQVVIGAVVGIGVPYGIFYLYHRKFSGLGGGSGGDRFEYEDKPDKAVDHRHEADEAPELKLDDIDFDDIPETPP